MRHFMFERSFGEVTTQIAMLGTYARENGDEGAGEFFYAEDYHQVHSQPLQRIIKVQGQNIEFYYFINFYKMLLFICYNM